MADSKALCNAEPSQQSTLVGDWYFKSVKSHILHSKCELPDICSTTPTTTNTTTNNNSNSSSSLCDYCKFTKLLELPELPEMCFPQSLLLLEHTSGVGICFNAFDALSRVDAHNDILKVKNSEKWRKDRSNIEYTEKVIHPFDWTYSTDYKGTIISPDNTSTIVIADTTDRINMEKLKCKENILFYDDVILFDDELADNGCSELRVKIRVMASGFLVLLRFFLRIDGVLIRMYDTRLYYSTDNSSYILRECIHREGRTDMIHPSLHTNPEELVKVLQVKQCVTEKLILPS